MEPYIYTLAFLIIPIIMIVKLNKRKKKKENIIKFRGIVKSWKFEPKYENKNTLGFITL